MANPSHFSWKCWKFHEVTLKHIGAIFILSSQPKSKCAKISQKLTNFLVNDFKELTPSLWIPHILCEGDFFLHRRKYMDIGSFFFGGASPANYHTKAIPFSSSPELCLLIPLSTRSSTGTAPAPLGESRSWTCRRCRSPHGRRGTPTTSS